MLGLGYIFLFGLYLLLIRASVRVTAKWARKRNQSVHLWSFLVGVGMLSTVFWDVIPIYGTHYYQCSSKGGFNVYKTLEEWKHDNPGVAETLEPVNERATVEGDTTRYWLNQRFSWDTKRSVVWYTLSKKEEKIIDVKTGEVLAENIDFYTKMINPVVTPTTNLRNFKLWMHIDHCKKDRTNNKWLVDGDSFMSLQTKFERIKGEI